MKYLCWALIQLLMDYPRFTFDDSHYLLSIPFVVVCFDLRLVRVPEWKCIRLSFLTDVNRLNESTRKWLRV